MRRIIMTAFAHFALLLCAQGGIYQIDYATNIPRDGDRLVRKQVEMPIIQYSDSMLWDFSSLPLKNSCSELRYISLNDSVLVRVEGRENTSFVYAPDGMKMVSSCGQGKKLDYALAERRIRYPMGYGDSISCYFYSEGTSGGTSFLRQAGVTSVAVVGSGRLITPDCDSLRHVLLTQYKRVGTTELGGDFDRSLSISLDSTLLSRDSIGHMLRNDSITHLHEVYSWWAYGYRYPILESERIVSFYKGQPADSVKVTYYVSPHYQMHYLREDSCNARCREVESLEPFDMPQYSYTIKAPFSGRNPMDLGYIAGHNNDCELAPLIVDASTTLSYHVETQSDISISIFDVAGTRLHIRTVSGRQGYGSIVVDTSDLPSGVFLVTVEIGKEPFSFKIFKQ